MSGHAALSSMAELFEPPPTQWGLRGDPPVWAAMRDRLRSVALPGTAGARVAALTDAFHAVVGAGPDADDGQRTVYRRELDAGGMSGGVVHLPTWQDRLIPLLAYRAAAASDGRDWSADPHDLALRRAPS